MTDDGGFLKGVGIYMASSDESKDVSLLETLRDAGARTLPYPTSPGTTHVLVSIDNREWISVTEKKPLEPPSRRRWTLNETMWYFGYVDTGGRASGNERAKFVVRKQWVIDCIAEGKQLPVKEYILKGTTDPARVTADENKLPALSKTLSQTPLVIAHPPKSAPSTGLAPASAAPEPSSRPSLLGFVKDLARNRRGSSSIPPVPAPSAPFTMGSLLVHPRSPQRVQAYDPRLGPPPKSQPIVKSKSPSMQFSQLARARRPATPPFPPDHADASAEASRCIDEVSVPVPQTSDLVSSPAPSSTPATSPPHGASRRLTPVPNLVTDPASSVIGSVHTARPQRPVTPPLPPDFDENVITARPEAGPAVGRGQWKDPFAQQSPQPSPPTTAITNGALKAPGTSPTNAEETAPPARLMTACKTPPVTASLSAAVDGPTGDCRSQISSPTPPMVAAPVMPSQTMGRRSLSPVAPPPPRTRPGTPEPSRPSKRRKTGSPVEPAHVAPCPVPPNSPPILAPPTPRLTDEPRHDSPPVITLEPADTLYSQAGKPAIRPAVPSNKLNDDPAGPIFRNAFGLAYSFYVACPESPATTAKLEVLIQHLGKGELVNMEEAMYIVVEHSPGQIAVRMNVEEVILAQTANRPSKVVVSHTWIEDCSSEGVFIDHRPYIVQFIDDSHLERKDDYAFPPSPQLGHATNPICLVDDEEDDDDLYELQADIGETGMTMAGPSRPRMAARSRSPSVIGSLIIAEADDDEDLDHSGRLTLGDDGADQSDDGSESASEWEGEDDNTMGYGKASKASSKRKSKQKVQRKCVAEEHKEDYEYLRGELEKMPLDIGRSKFLQALEDKREGPTRWLWFFRQYRDLLEKDVPDLKRFARTER